MRWLGKHGGLAIVLIGVGVAGWAVFGQSRPANESQKVAALFAQVRPHVEAVLRTRIAEPDLRPISRADLAKLAHPDAERYLRFRFPHLEGPQLTQAVLATRRAFANASVACRVPGSNVIYLVRDPLALGSANVALAQTALAYEVVCSSLEARRPVLQDVEQLVAWQAVVEGKALELTHQVAKRMKCEESVSLLAERFIQVPDEDLDTGLRTVTQTTLRQRHWAMTQGREFMRYLDEQKVDESLVFSRPPRQLEWIKQPEKYVQALRENRPEMRDLLAKVEGSMPAPWTPFHQAWTGDMVVQVAGLVNEKPRAEKYVSQWQEGRTLVWSRPDNPSQHVAVSVARFTKPGDARSYFNFAVELQRKQDVATAESCGLPFVVKESKSSAFRHPAVEEGVLNNRLLQSKSGRMSTRANTLLARQGDAVLEISWYGAAADTAWANEVIGKVLQQSPPP